MSRENLGYGMIGAQIKARQLTDAEIRARNEMAARVAAAADESDRHVTQRSGAARARPERSGTLGS